jgi:hypothetical protein
MPKYTVGTTKQVQKQIDGGGLVIVNRQWITTDHGGNGYIDVMPRDWTAERLREILDAFADELDLAHNLELGNDS